MTKLLLSFGLVMVFGIYITTDAQVIVESDLDTGVEVTTDATTSGQLINTSGSVEGSIKVERESLNEGDEVILIDASSVNTSSDLELYVRSILLGDTNVEEVNFEKGNVDLKYKQKGKMFGLFSINYDIEVDINDDREINVKYPWYAAFTTNSNKAVVRERMETEVGDLLDRNSNASGEIEMNARAMAQIASLVHTILVEELNVDASLGDSSN